MKRNIGIIIILVGIGIILVSIFFSSGYSHRRDFLSNLYRMEIVLDPGKWKKVSSVGPGKISDEELLAQFDGKKNYKTRKIAIPLKYLLTFSVVFILVGTGILLLKRKT